MAARIAVLLQTYSELTYVRPVLLCEGALAGLLRGQARESGGPHFVLWSY